MAWYEKPWACVSIVAIIVLGIVVSLGLATKVNYDNTVRDARIAEACFEAGHTVAECR